MGAGQAAARDIDEYLKSREPRAWQAPPQPAEAQKP
jgi:hypothetical protein